MRAQLIINEVSQGISGTKEYVELLVTGTVTCSGIPTVDLRGWYIDDNNGAHATGSGTGIAAGCIRFTQDALWSAVPIGTLIVIYNDADPNPAVPAADLSLGDGNCRLIIPVSNCTLIEKNTTTPTLATAAYPTTGFTSCGSWTTVGMANSDDSFQTVDPLGNIVHSVSWGNNTLNTIIYFAGTSAGMVAWMNNAVDNNPALQGNWTRTTASGTETPGLPNNAANAQWIATMNLNCMPWSPLAATGTATNTCSCDGTATASPSGGAGSYTYSWAPSGGNSATATNLCPGTYTCTVTDLAGCTQQVIVTVGANPSPTVTLTGSSNVTCNGASNGSATVNATGGSGNYSYNWAPGGGSSATASGLPNGNYTVTVTDGSGCTASQTVAITQPPYINTFTTQTNVNCNGGNNGTATVNASGGTGTLNFSWAPSGGNAATATGLSAGSYTCTVTDANNCTVSEVMTITQPPAIAATISSTNVGCNGGNDGTATVVASGGTGALSYAWTPSGGTAATATGLTAGNYSCTITDANNCTSIVSVTITEPAAITASAGNNATYCEGSTIALSGTATGPVTSVSWQGGTGTFSSPGSLNTNYTPGIGETGSVTFTLQVMNTCDTAVSSLVITFTQLPSAQIVAGGPVNICAGDSVLLTASGGTSFLWSTGATGNSIYAHTAGTYSVIVISNCGSDTAQQTITVQPLPVAQITAGGPTTFCTGGNVTLTASGGNTYLWSNTATTPAIVVNSSGTYTVSVSSGCGVDTQTVTVNVLPLPNAQITANGPTTFCTNGNVTLTASGGTSYVWSTAATTAAIIVNTAGTYTVAATNTCGTDTQTISVSVLPLPIAQITANGPTTFCTGGNVTLTASGGSSYLWSNSATTAAITVNTAGTYTVAVSNACGVDTETITVNTLPLPVAQITTSGPTTFCSGGNVTLTASGGGTYLWSNSATTPSITVNTAGTYTVGVTNSCGTSTQSVTVNVLSLPVAQITANGPTTFCSGGNVTLTANGGTSYTWSNSATTSSITVNTAGTYTVTASNVCGTDTAMISVAVLPAPVASISGNTTICAGDVAVLTASGNGSFLWSNGATTSSISVSTAGTYSVSVTNACGTDIASVNVAVGQVTANFTPDVISGTAPVNIVFTDNSSSSAVSWQWNFGDGNNSSQQDPANTYTSGGNYVVVLTVSDALGCTDTATALIVVTDIPSLLTVPNVFTPNGDGTNDFFLTQNEGLKTFSLQIFDRWGMLLFETEDPSQGWDGKNTSGGTVVDGTYYYVITASGFDKKTYAFSGFLTLLH